MEIRNQNIAKRIIEVNGEYVPVKIECSPRANLPKIKLKKYMNWLRKMNNISWIGIS